MTEVKLFLQSSQIPTRVYELCLWASTAVMPRQAASSQLEPTAEHPRVSLSHCGPPGWEWHHQHPETGGERGQSNLHATHHHHHHQPYQTKLHPQTRWLSDCFPRPVQTSWRELSRLSDHLHHRQFSQLQTNNYSLYTLLIRMDLSSLRCRATWGEETTTWIEFCWFLSYQNTRGHAGHQHRVRGHAVHCSGDWGPEEKKKPKREMHWIGYINIFATIWISILVVHMYGRQTS